MKQEKAKKRGLLIWIIAGAVVLLAAAGVTLALLFGPLGGQSGETEQGRPELYWNIDRVLYTENSESGLSTREPGEDGIYRIRFAFDGQQLELPVSDKQLVNYIDSMSAMGLVIDADGVVVDAIDPEEIADVVGTGIAVMEVKDTMILANSSIAMNGMKFELDITDQTQVYNLAADAQLAGEIIAPTQLALFDTLSVYGTFDGEVTHIYLTKRADKSPVYWRADRMWDSAAKATARVPDENGVYTVSFTVDGSLVTLKCKDRAIVTKIDSVPAIRCHFGLLFDEEGYIIQIIDSGVGIGAALAVNQAEVTEVNGTYFSCVQQLVGDKGTSYSGTMTENCKIYDASPMALRDGRFGQPVDSLKPGDRVCVWKDLQGNAVLVYICNRRVDGPPYFNVTRKYNTTQKEPTREPVNGYYEFEMVEVGKQGTVILKTADKALASYIDSISYRTLGLKLDGNIILNAYDSNALYGWGTDSGYIASVQGTIVTLAGYGAKGNQVNYIMDPNYKVYDISGKDVPYGTETTLRQGDTCYMVRNPANNGVLVMVYRRVVGGDTVYYLLDRQWDSTTKETKRTPDEDGWYVFTVAHKGKQVQVKTKNKALANRIEETPTGDLVLCMRVENGIVRELYETAAAYGRNLYPGHRVSAINGDGTYTVMSSSGKEYTLKMADDCVIYNVSDVYDSHRGERTYSLQVGDMVASLADGRDNVKLIYVRKRAVDNMYANTQRLYEVYEKVSLRQPDAEGWYWFDLAVGGQVKRFKTKDQALVNTIDSYTTPFGLRVKDDVICNLVAPTWVKGVYKAGDSGWDITAISGSKVTIQYNKPGAANAGTSKTISVGSRVKVYDISPTAESFGAAVKLQVGDRITTYLDREGNVVYAFVTSHMSREKGSTGYCEHCKQEVLWQPWTGENWSAYDAHYYVAGDLELTKQTSLGNTTRDFEIVLDLNGKKVTVNHCRAFLVYRNETLSIVDSVGGGVVEATGIIGGVGGTVLVNGGGTLNLYSGTLDFVESELKHAKGATLHVSGAAFNMYGGTVRGGIVNDPDAYALGGNLYLNNATFNMYGGVIEGGRAVRNEQAQPSVGAQGGNIYAFKKSVINLFGGEIKDGYSNNHGGNVFLYDATLNMSGGSISGGEAKSNAGNIYNQFAGIVNITGGVVEKGKAGTRGDDLFASHNTGTLIFAGGSLNGDFVVGNAATVTLSGAVKLSALQLPSGLKADVKGLTEGAFIGIRASGVFTDTLEKPEDYLQYFEAASLHEHIEVDQGALKIVSGGDINRLNAVHTAAEQMTADGVFNAGGTVTAVCPVCGTEQQWIDLAQYEGGTQFKENTHYYLSDSVQLPKHYSINVNACVHLNGKNITSEAGAFYIEDTFTVNLMGQGNVSGVGRKHATRGWWGAVDVVGSVNLYGGTYTCTSEGPAISGKSTSAASVINMYEGAAVVRTDGLGMGIRLYDETDFNMYGGTISGAANNLLQQTGYFAKKYSVINIYGGTIEKGTAAQGGNIHASGATNTLNIYGGKITEGSVYAAEDLESFAVSGAPVISQLDLTSGMQLTLGKLEENASILVLADGVIAQGLEETEGYLAFIKTFNENDEIYAKGDKLIVRGDKTGGKNKLHLQAEQMTADGVFASGGTVTAVCPVCGTEQQWIDLAQYAGGSKFTEGTHYYLSDSVQIPKHYNFNVNACVHLNGKNITSEAGAFYIENKFTVNFMGQGNVSGVGRKNASRGWWGTVDVVGSVNLYGGTYTCTSEGPAISGKSTSAASVINMYEGAAVVRTDGLGMGIRLYDETDFNMYGGTISGAANNLLQQTGYFAKKYSVINIYGGTIEKGTAAQGGNIHASGATNSLNIYGGKITEGSVYAAEDLGSFTVSDAPVISLLDLSSGKKLTLGALFAAEITVKAPDGAFTEATEKAAQYVEFFRTDLENKTVKEADGTLVIADA